MVRFMEATKAKYLHPRMKILLMDSECMGLTASGVEDPTVGSAKGGFFDEIDENEASNTPQNDLQTTVSQMHSVWDE